MQMIDCPDHVPYLFCVTDPLLLLLLLDHGCIGNDNVGEVVLADGADGECVCSGCSK